MEDGVCLSASKYTYFFVFFTEITLHIRVKIEQNTEDKSAQEGVASITTNGQVRVKPRKIRGKLPQDTDDFRVNLEAMCLEW